MFISTENLLKFVTTTSQSAAAKGKPDNELRLYAGELKILLYKRARLKIKIALSTLSFPKLRKVKHFIFNIPKLGYSWELMNKILTTK